LFYFYYIDSPAANNDVSVKFQLREWDETNKRFIYTVYERFNYIYNTESGSLGSITHPSYITMSTSVTAS
jgi:hypothetical protein